MFLYNTAQVILQNFAATVMSLVRRKKSKTKQNTPTSGITMPAKPPVDI